MNRSLPRLAIVGIASILSWAVGVLLAAMVKTPPLQVADTDCHWPGTRSLPPVARLVKESSSFGVRIRLLRVDTYRYDTHGRLQYWSDGEWGNAIDRPAFVAQRCEVTWVEAGFPFYTVHGGTVSATSYCVGLPTTTGVVYPPVSIHSMSGAASRLIPFRPAWLGLPLNVGLCAFAISLWIAMRRALRKIRRQCTACAYPIGTSPVCTECGSLLRALGEVA